MDLICCFSSFISLLILLINILVMKCRYTFLYYFWGIYLNSSTISCAFVNISLTLHMFLFSWTFDLLTVCSFFSLFLISFWLGTLVLQARDRRQRYLVKQNHIIFCWNEIVTSFNFSNGAYHFLADRCMTL